MNSVIKAGWGEVDITPDGENIEVVGQYYKRMAQGIHSRLKAVALVLEQEEEVAVMITLDVATIPEDFTRQIQSLISETIIAIPKDKIIINAIHTHNAPDLDIKTDWQRGTQEGDSSEEYRRGFEYRAFVVDKILEAVKKAWDTRKVTGISDVLDYARVGHCRRAVYTDGTAEMYGDTSRNDFAGMEGGEDSGVDLLFFFDKDGKATGLIVNVACPSQVMEATYFISSDYMGALRMKLKKEFGESFTTLSQISAAGCQAPRDLTRGYKGEPDFWHEDGVEELANRLLSAVKRGYKKAVTNIIYDVQIKHETKNVDLPRRRASYLDYVSAVKEIETLQSVKSTEEHYKDFCDEVKKNEKIPGRPGPYDSKLHSFVKIKNAEAVINRYNEQDKHPNFTMELHVVRIGDIVFATNPFELFLDFGHQIKARSIAGHTFLVQLANGTGMYLPSKRSEQLGGYGGLIVNGFVGSDGGKMLVDETVSTIKSLFD